MQKFSYCTLEFTIWKFTIESAGYSHFITFTHLTTVILYWIIILTYAYRLFTTPNAGFLACPACVSQESVRWVTCERHAVFIVIATASHVTKGMINITNIHTFNGYIIWWKHVVLFFSHMFTLRPDSTGDISWRNVKNFARNNCTHAW